MADHAFRIESDSPSNDDLMFWSLVGHEALARPSFYELTILSTNHAIDAKGILGRAFDVVIEFLDEAGTQHERHCQGHAVRFARVEAVGRYFSYHITLRSWFWLLTKRRNSRILQEKTVLEVLDDVFEDSPIKRFAKRNVDYVLGIREPRRYCVQHQESDYQYLSRLLEDEGIYYWFDSHDSPGKMHLADASDVAHGKLPANNILRSVPTGATEARFNQISKWISARQFDTGTHASVDSNFKAVNNKLGATIDVSDSYELAKFEDFEFPGGYFSSADSETRARIRGEELEARRDRHWALTSWPDVAVGKRFTYEGDPDGTRDGEYVIAACTFVCSHPGYESVNINDNARATAQVLRAILADDAVNADTRDVLEELLNRTPQLQSITRGSDQFLLTLIPVEMPFRPPRLTPPVVMPGPQSAIVVGPVDEEIHTDSHGRVKVQFHWDRYGRSDEESTCWVRVSQPWAGKGWGGYFIPRIGQEVIVDFLNGDPDRPVIIGRVYNDEQPIPYQSPTRSGFKTRSTRKGNPSNYNEFMFDDKKGEEWVNIHAERNMSTSVEVDDSTSVGHNQGISVGHDQGLSVGNDRVETVGQDRTVVVKRNEKKIIHDSQKTQIQNFQDLTVGANRHVIVGGFQKTQIGANNDIEVVGYMNTKVGIDYSLQVRGNTGIVSGANTRIETIGERNDVTHHKHAIMANEIKLVSANDINIIAVANVNTISYGSNTTIIGSNSSGYIGESSDTNIGTVRSNFQGIKVDNGKGLALSFHTGDMIGNLDGNQISKGGKSISYRWESYEFSLNKVFAAIPEVGAPAEALISADAAIDLMLSLPSFDDLNKADSDIKETLAQYENAFNAINDAMGEASRQGLELLASRLFSLGNIVQRRLSLGKDFLKNFPTDAITRPGRAISVSKPDVSWAPMPGASHHSSAASKQPSIPNAPLNPDTPLDPPPPMPEPYGPSSDKKPIP